jgi:hypothetical protein
MRIKLILDFMQHFTFLHQINRCGSQFFILQLQFGFQLFILSFIISDSDFSIPIGANIAGVYFLPRAAAVVS